MWGAEIKVSAPHFFFRVATVQATMEAVNLLPFGAR